MVFVGFWQGILVCIKLTGLHITGDTVQWAYNSCEHMWECVHNIGQTEWLGHQELEAGLFILASCYG